jgi:ubiquinone/menaquinone biosynthesis C-methylase UbiE
VYFSTNPLVRFINWKKLDSILSLLLVRGRDKILDFGCGNGVMLPTMSGKFNTVVGIDLCITAASRMSRAYGLKNVFLITADGMNLPFRDESFDAVLATSALEHFRDLERAVTEIARVARRGGSLLFLSPTENVFYRFGRWLFRYKKPEDHYHSAKDIEGVLEKFCTAELRKGFPSAFPPFFSIYRLGRFRVK